MAPGKRAELVAAIPRRFEEADRRVVDGEGMGLKRTGRTLGADEARLPIERAGSAGDSRSQLGHVPKATVGARGADEAGEARVAEPHEHSLRPTLAAAGQVDGPDLRGRERSGAGQARRRSRCPSPLPQFRGSSLCSSAIRLSGDPHRPRLSRRSTVRRQRSALLACLFPSLAQRRKDAIVESFQVLHNLRAFGSRRRAAARLGTISRSAARPRPRPGSPPGANGRESSPRWVTWAMKR